jgi:Ca2+-transporting ATPase
MAMITILSQYIALKTDFLKEKWQTVVFTVLCFSQLGHALAIRHLQKNF